MKWKEKNKKINKGNNRNKKNMKQWETKAINTQEKKNEGKIERKWQNGTLGKRKTDRLRERERRALKKPKH